MNRPAPRATLAPDPNSETGAIAVLAIVAGNEAYGFPLSAVREILMPPPLTKVPRSAEHFQGVISVRGQIITLIDLPKMLRLEVGQPRPCGRVLLVDNGEELVGVAVDSVIQVYRLEPSQIEFASAMGAELSDYVVGVGRVSSASSPDAEELLILIDPVSLFGARHEQG
ncbi:MAG: chemotaxis protein CheW [Polyangiales bacterium]|jgi:purine-binding chemotaxis protein CheW